MRLFRPKQKAPRPETAPEKAPETAHEKALEAAPAEAREKVRARGVEVLPEVRVEHEFGHSGVLSADPFAYRTAHRRLAWLLRSSVAINVVLGACLAVTTQALTSLVPLKTTEVALLRADPSDDRIYRVEPISVNVDGFELLLEKLSRRYVRQILTIDETTQNTRFAEVRSYSDADFFNHYVKTNKPFLDQALKDGLNRSITIKGAYKVDAYNGVFLYVVEFQQVDRMDRTEPVRRDLRAFLELTPRPNEVTEAEKFENPLGIRVLGMSIKEQASE